jgi:hypothetical protein
VIAEEDVREYEWCVDEVIVADSEARSFSFPAWNKNEDIQLRIG